MTPLIAHHAEDLAAWENEGGARRFCAPLSPISKASAARAGAFQAPSARIIAADAGVAGEHTLAIMRIALIMVVPLLAGIAMFRTPLVATGASG